MSSRKIGIVVYPDSEELDWAGPYEVFTMAAQVGGDLEVVTISQHEGPVRCAKGLRILPDHSFETAPQLDVVLVPGGEGSRVEMDNPVMLDWLVKAAESCTWVTSVCTGSILLAKSGLATGCEITTHWAYITTLRELAPHVTVRENIRYVRDGRIVTAAGVSAGIDMSLWLVGELFDADHSRKTRRFMEYDPEPPY
ncbi:MAG: DJ-1/PfpI family protein [Deltaproteobacteria bacterium]|nr:DJ-1/PfpI family protein [Deltaproteobacteria bacterium]MBW2382233.1 DJ-1/PfpI family protein [Deltaproteobacteria bacterium]MBW2696438.1 DJ-1/PfpI family protein [Deltaproteobacteria bacterium]